MHMMSKELGKKTAISKKLAKGETLNSNKNFALEHNWKIVILFWLRLPAGSRQSEVSKRTPVSES